MLDGLSKSKYSGYIKYIATIPNFTICSSFSMDTDDIERLAIGVA